MLGRKTGLAPATLPGAQLLSPGYDSRPFYPVPMPPVDLRGGLRLGRWRSLSKTPSMGDFCPYRQPCSPYYYAATAHLFLRDLSLGRPWGLRRQAIFRRSCLSTMASSLVQSTHGPDDVVSTFAASFTPRESISRRLIKVRREGCPILRDSIGRVRGAFQSRQDLSVPRKYTWQHPGEIGLRAPCEIDGLTGLRLIDPLKHDLTENHTDQLQPHLRGEDR